MNPGVYKKSPIDLVGAAKKKTNLSPTRLKQNKIEKDILNFAL